jgi:cyclic-di-GMP phosphodiesterase, flagellum assembly factor TipF
VTEAWFDIPLGIVVAALALGWLAHAFRAERRMAALSRELTEMARAMDATLGSLPGRDKDRFVSHEELPRLLSRELDSLASKLAVNGGGIGDEPDRKEAVAPNVVSLAPKPRLGEAPHSEEPAGNERIGKDLAAAIASDRLEVSLQPIVSISRGESVAFDLFAHLRQEDGTQRDIRRIGPVEALDGTHFEQAMMLSAMDTARRRLGTMSERMKLHVAVSEALLSRGEAVSDICEILRIHPGIARSIVLCLPVSVLDQPEMFAPIRELFDAGLTLVLECDDELPREMEGMPPVGVARISAANLLAMAAACGSPDEPRLPAPLAGNAGMIVIACEVSSDDDAMKLIDLGIDLMSGERFSPPRLLGQGAAPEQNPPI